MPIAAAWHSTLVVPTADPFDIAVRIEDVAVPIVLSADGRQGELRTELLSTVEAELRLADRGITCKIKGTVGASCHVCPLFDAVDELCQLGRVQERLITELRVEHLGGRRD